MQSSPSNVEMKHGTWNWCHKMSIWLHAYKKISSTTLPKWLIYYTAASCYFDPLKCWENSFRLHLCFSVIKLKRKNRLWFLRSYCNWIFIYICNKWLFRVHPWWDWSALYSFYIPNQFSSTSLHHFKNGNTKSIFCH